MAFIEVVRWDLGPLDVPGGYTFSGSKDSVGRCYVPDLDDWQWRFQSVSPSHGYYNITANSYQHAAPIGGGSVYRLLSRNQFGGFSEANNGEITNFTTVPKAAGTTVSSFTTIIQTTQDVSGSEVVVYNSSASLDPSIDYSAFVGRSISSRTVDDDTLTYASQDFPNSPIIEEIIYKKCQGRLYDYSISNGISTKFGNRAVTYFGFKDKYSFGPIPGVSVLDELQIEAAVIPHYYFQPNEAGNTPISFISIDPITKVFTFEEQDYYVTWMPVPTSSSIGSANRGVVLAPQVQPVEWDDDDVNFQKVAPSVQSRIHYDVNSVEKVYCSSITDTNEEVVSTLATPFSSINPYRVSPTNAFGLRYFLNPGTAFFDSNKFEDYYYFKLYLVDAGETRNTVDLGWTAFPNKKLEVTPIYIGEYSARHWYYFDVNPNDLEIPGFLDNGGFYKLYTEYKYEESSPITKSLPNTSQHQLVNAGCPIPFNSKAVEGRPDWIERVGIVKRNNIFMANETRLLVAPYDNPADTGMNVTFTYNPTLKRIEIATQAIRTHELFYGSSISYVKKGITSNNIDPDYKKILEFTGNNATRSLEITAIDDRGFALQLSSGTNYRWSKGGDICTSVLIIPSFNTIDETITTYNVPVSPLLQRWVRLHIKTYDQYNTTDITKFIFIPQPT